MKYYKLGEDVYLPNHCKFPLKSAIDLKFNYYISSRVNGSLIDLDITSKIFDGDDVYVRKSSYRVKLGEIENCVKANIKDHMIKLGVENSNIPPSLNRVTSPKHKMRYTKNTA